MCRAQAYVCSTVLGCCPPGNDALQSRVEDALYGNSYPRALLPVSSCKEAGNIAIGGTRLDSCSGCRSATSVQLYSDASMCTPRAASLREQYQIQPLSLHERVSSETADRRHKTPAELRLPRVAGSKLLPNVKALLTISVFFYLQCEFVSDIVQTSYDRLIAALNDAVCACAGCCHDNTEGGTPGEGQHVSQCLFDAPQEDAWIAALIETL